MVIVFWMNLTKHKYIFELIAPFYNWFFKGQYSRYSEIFKKYSGALNIPDGARVLDIGCGTGALTKVFADSGFSVTGVDLARNMIRYGLNRGLDCHFGNALMGLPFPDKSFDMVAFAYVAHGLDSKKRNRLFLESARLSRKIVLIHDYGVERSFGTNLIEFLEGGDYFNFIRYGIDEMKTVFKHVQIIDVDSNAKWYICFP